MVIRIDHAQELMDVKCPACDSSIIQDRDKAQKIWNRYSVANSTPSKQLYDAKKFVSGMECKSCVTATELVSEPESIKSTTSFSTSIEAESDGKEIN